MIFFMRFERRNDQLSEIAGACRPNKFFSCPLEYAFVFKLYFVFVCRFLFCFVLLLFFKTTPVHTLIFHLLCIILQFAGPSSSKPLTTAQHENLRCGDVT